MIDSNCTLLSCSAQYTCILFAFGFLALALCTSIEDTWQDRYLGFEHFLDPNYLLQCVMSAQDETTKLNKPSSSQLPTSPIASPKIVRAWMQKVIAVVGYTLCGGIGTTPNKSMPKDIFS
jgi:hypothetical protein